MRITLVSQEYPPETARGGIGTQTFVKAHGLAALGHSIHVISRSPDQIRREYMDGAVTVTRIPDMSDRLPLYTTPADWLTYSTEVAVAVTSLQERLPIDVVDFPEWGSEGYVYLANRTEWNSIPTVIHLHGPLVMFAHQLRWPALDSTFYQIGAHMEATCLRLADAVFSSSACSTEWCASHYGLCPESIPTLHTGVDISLFRPATEPRDSQPSIVFVGNVTTTKGVELLLEAAIALAVEIPELRLRIIGRGEEEVERRLVSRAGDAGRSDLLELVGFVPREKLPEQLTRAQVFAVPSEYEGGPGFVYLEAMACGLPVIACAGSGAAEVVSHEQTGLLVRPRNLKDLVDALRRLLFNPELRRTLGSAARRYAAEQANGERCVQRIASFYESVTSRTTRPEVGGGRE